MRRACPSDLSDAAYAALLPHLPRSAATGRPWKHELREILEDREKAYMEATALLRHYEDLAGIYNIGSGNQGIGRALQEQKRERQHQRQSH